MGRTINWGILGCGDVTEVKSGPGFYKASNSRLEAVMRRDAEKARDYARRHGVPRWYSDAQALIDDPEVGAIYIATRPDTHRDYALRCAKAGKATLVEKPLGRTAKEATEIVDTFAKFGVPLFCAYYRRALPRFTQIKELIDGGHIGQLRFIRITQLQPEPPQDFDQHGVPWRYEPAVGGGGIFADMGSHEIDILDFFLGPIVRARGMAVNQARRYAAEDLVVGSFEFAAGAMASGLWCYSSRQQEDEIHIVGSEGEIRFACFSPSPIIITTQTGTRQLDLGDPAHVHQPLIQTIVDELNGQGHCPSTSASALRVNHIIDELLADYRSSGALS